MLWVFDVNETLLDLSPLDEVFGSDVLRMRWFAALVRAALVSAATGQYRDFAQVGADCARALGCNEDEVARVGSTMRRLPAHPEAAAAIRALKARGDRLVALTNSPHAVADEQLEHSGLAAVLGHAYSAQDAHALKPAAGAYRHLLEAEGIAPSEAVLVAAHDWDVAGAQAVGMRTVFVARAGGPLPGWPPPDAILADLTALSSVTFADSAR